MIITLLFPPHRVCSYKPEHIVLKTYSPLNRLVSRPLSLAIPINHKKERSTSLSLKDHQLFLLSPLLVPTRCTPVTDVSLRIYPGIPIEYSLPLIGCVQMIASGTVALGSSRKNPA